jgi:peptide/nickel transport system substrate-binding protein
LVIEQSGIFTAMKKYCALFIAICIFSGCVEKQSSIDDTTVFRYNEHANITSLDPAFAKDQRNIWASNLMYNGLVKLNQDLEVIPDLASSWTVSDDGLTYTFQLKDSIWFHESDLFKDSNVQRSNRLVDAYDFKYSLERLSDPYVASPGAWTMSRVKNVDVLNDLTLQIELNQAFPAFLGLLSMKFCSVVPHSNKLRSQVDLRANPIGTGPFYKKKWEENVKLVLRKHDDYFEKDTNGIQLPYLEAVAITFLSDKQSEFLEFAKGNLDFINALDPSYKDELLTTTGELKPAYRTTVNMEKAPFLNTEYLGLKLDGNRTSVHDLNFRRAVNLGFDRGKMIRYLRNDVGIPANHGFIPIGLPAGGEIEGYSYDPIKARAYLSKYQKLTGDKNPNMTISTGTNYLDLCEYIQKELEKIGIQVTIDVMPPSTLRQARSAGNLQAFRSSWIADYPDAQNYLALFYSKNFAPDGPNYTHFKRVNYDTIYEKALATANIDARNDLYRQLDSIIIDRAAVVPLYYDQSVRFVRKNVQGLQSNAVNMLDLTRVSKN